MLNPLMQLLPLAGIFLAGVVAHRMGWVSQKQSSFLLKFVFYFGLPVVIFLAIDKVQLDSSLLSFALLSPAVIVATVIVALLLRRWVLERVRAKTFASMLAGATILNISILYPFIATSYGVDGLARLAVIDCFNIIMISSVLYVVMAILVQRRPNIRAIVIRVVAAPILWALAAGLLFKLSGATLPQVAVDAFQPFALLMSWILLFAIGDKVKWQLKNPTLFVLGLLLRFGLGGLVGWVLVRFFGLHGLNAEIILIASMAPIGLNSITLAEVEKLDEDFAVSAVSGGLVVGIIFIPFIIHFVHSVRW
jgi:predicted permease